MTSTHIQKEVSRQMTSILPLTEELLSEEDLRAKLTESVLRGRPLRVKQGIDPTSPDVHIGHMVPYRLMRAFQDHGHLAILVIGDITARIGDPTDRDAERRHLDGARVDRNARTYTDQIFTVVDRSRAEVRLQSEWFGDTSLVDTIDLLSQFSVAQMLAHETFRARMDAGKRLSLHELVYPVLQAQDSVAIEADVEIGGSDQKFNMLCGRDLLRFVGRPPQVVITTPLLPGLDGRKMSKSFENHIPVLSEAEEMYGKVMAIPDEALPSYYRLASGLTHDTAEHTLSRLRSGDVHPREAKARLAECIVSTYRGREAAKEAAATFESVFRRGEIPTDLPRVEITDGTRQLCTVMSERGLTASSSEARRLIKQTAVSCNGATVNDQGVVADHLPWHNGECVLRVGKRRFYRLVKSF